MLRVLVVDDSHVARNLITAILAAHADVKVIGEAENGIEAVRKVAELRPDIITMDVQMPRMDGYTATREIMMSTPTPIVMISGSTGHDDVEKSIRSLDAGALTVMKKPPSPTSTEFDLAATKLVSTIRSMADVKVIRKHRPRQIAPDPPQKSLPDLDMPARPKLVVMAASTGGPQAIRTVLAKLPVDFALPIVIVQHISTGFTNGFAEWLSRTIDLQVELAAHGQTIQPGTIYLAPESSHCSVKPDGAIALSTQPPISGFRPSANVLFDSAARSFGTSLVAVIMTGMGRDGVEGLRSVRQNGGTILAQDEDTSVVYGMPKAATDAGLPDRVLPLTELATTLRRLAMPT